MSRSKRSQSKHDGLVKKIAQEYKDKGYKVKADVEGYSQPGTIGGLRPDILAQKGAHQSAVEVETPESVGNKRDQKQQKAFKDWSKRSPTKHYRRLVTKK